MDIFRAALDLLRRGGPDQTQRMLVQVFDGGSIPTGVPRVYLTHPTLADAGDTEGATPTFAADTAVTIPVVVLGPKVPVAGDHLIAHAIAGRWLAGDGGSSPALTSCCCAPCRIPNCEDGGQLTLSSNLGGSVTLTRGLFGGLDQFYSTSVPWASHDGTGFATFACDDSHTPPTSELSVGDTYGTGMLCTSIPGSGGAHGLSLADYTCSPFHLHYTVSALICSGLAALGYTDFYLDGPAADPPTCCLLYFSALGCNDLDGNPQTVVADVSIWTDSGKGTLLASGTTADTFDVVTAGTYYYEVSAHGFVTAAGTKAFTCFSTTEVTLTPADGYTCAPGCANPVADTLHGTHSVFGAITFTRDVSGPLGDGWYATVSHSYPGCYCCPSGTVTVDCFLDTSFNYQEQWTSS